MVCSLPYGPHPEPYPMFCRSLCPPLENDREEEAGSLRVGLRLTARGPYRQIICTASASKVGKGV